jgi:16S rRNA (cytosine967-C5)-methyltransferase
LLSAVLWRGQPLEEALPWALQGVNDSRDRALARAIASTTLRWKTDLDETLDRLTSRPLPDDARARLVITAAFAQLAVLKLPPHAVISTALEQLEAGPRRLAHAVLTKAIDGALALPDRPTPPPVLFYNWQQTYPADIVAGLQDALAATPPLDLRLRDPATTNHWAKVLGGVSLMPGHVRLSQAGRIEALEGFGEGAWWVQELAAQMPALLLGIKTGDTVLDLCAAPGGKTMQLASLGAAVTALDQSGKRLERLRQNLDRTRLAAKIVTANALEWKPATPLGHILLDAPCSATGTYRRHPDVLWARASGSSAPTRADQAALLDRACDWLAPGGVLVYAVCALEEEEGEDQIRSLLARRSDVALTKIETHEAGPCAVGLTDAGWLRLRPDLLAADGGVDGFFIARLTRTS